MYEGAFIILQSNWWPLKVPQMQIIQHALWEYANVRCFASTTVRNDATISFMELEIIILCSITSHKDMKSGPLKQLRRAAAELKRDAVVLSSPAACFPSIK